MWRSTFPAEYDSEYQAIRIYYKTDDPEYLIQMIYGKITLPNEKGICCY